MFSDWDGQGTKCLAKQNKCVYISWALEINEVKLGEGEKSESKAGEETKGQ